MLRFLEYTKHLPSTLPYRLFTAVHAIGSTAARRVWTEMDTMRDHPNMYIILVGQPNAGKTVAMSKMIPLVVKAGAFAIGPKIATKQGLIDELGKNPQCYEAVLMPDMSLIDFYYMGLYWPEIANAFPEYNNDLGGLLTELWDCPDLLDEGLRTVKTKPLSFPGASMLVGAAIAKLYSTIPPSEWDSGFMARVVLIHSKDKPPSRNRFLKRPSDEMLEGEIVEWLKKLKELKGEMKWSLEAQDLYNEWADLNPFPPTHNLLTHYTERRPRHLSKLIMIAALNDLRMDVTGEDVYTALGWMALAESNMNSIFENMVSHEDGRMLENIGYIVGRHYATTKEAMSDETLTIHMAKAVPHIKIKSLKTVAEMAGYIKRVGGTTGSEAEYMPGDKYRKL